MAVGETQAPFVFACHRCGHCCRVGHGRVRIREEDLEPLARARGATVAAFAARYVVRRDDGLELRELWDGRCCMLEGLHDCAVYAARPEQCRSFPYWPGILAGGDALLQAASYCPGIELGDG